MLAAFSKGFKMLEEEKSPTFQEKLLDPLYEKLDAPLPEIKASDYIDKADIEFKKWAEKQGAGIPDFTFSQMFDTFPKYPKDENELVDKLADSIISKFDGSAGYILWVNRLATGYEAALGKKVLDKINEKSKNILKAVVNYRNTGLISKCPNPDKYDEYIPKNISKYPKKINLIDSHRTYLFVQFFLLFFSWRYDNTPRLFR
jgi:hypothetical protein